MRRGGGGAVEEKLLWEGGRGVSKMKALAKVESMGVWR